MQDPKIKTKVIHSKTKPAWNVVATSIGDKWKIARIPYYISENDEITTTRNKSEALNHAEFISKCFNNSTHIIENFFKY